jgi:hypothetical protein
LGPILMPDEEEFPNKLGEEGLFIIKLLLYED